LQSLPFDDRAADQYGYLRASLESTGQMIGSQDAMIAAIALAHNIPVVTENVREFIRVPGLKIESIRSVI
jgi:tRNA(fMet)-specific endonuclease VapC